MAPLRKLVTAAAAAALLATSATPAFARPWGYGGGYYQGGGYYGGGYDHGGGSGGALVGGLIVGGLLGAVVASSNNDRGSRGREEYRGPAPQDRAAEACAAAVEGERGGRVSQITDVGAFGDGWRVEGVIDSGERDARGYFQPDSFSCSVRYGRVDDVRYGSDYARR